MFFHKITIENKRTNKFEVSNLVFLCSQILFFQAKNTNQKTKHIQCFFCCSQKKKQNKMISKYQISFVFVYKHCLF